MTTTTTAWQHRRASLFRSRFGFAAISLAVVTVAWFALHVDHGLRAEYFATPDWRGTIERAGIDSEFSATQLRKRWLEKSDVPAQFSVQWSGHLEIPKQAVYRFSLTSDDGAQLYLDGKLVVDNGGRHRTRTRTGEVFLDEGSHDVVLRYSQLGGQFTVSWKWASESSDFRSVPLWLLTPRSHPYWLLLAVRIVGWLWCAAALVFLLLCPRWFWAHLFRVIGRPAVRHPAAACLLLFIGLAIVETWPLATNPAHLSRNDNADTQFNEWVLAWDAHQVLHDPLHLYDANIFYPTPDTLAYSESMLVQAAMGAPLLWLGASPVLTYNLLLLAGFALTGWAMCFLVARWTNDWIAGIASGVFVAFNAQAFTRLPHIQIQHVEFFPLALLALDALLREPRLRHSLALAGWYTLQALTSVYLLVFIGVALMAAALARPEDWLPPQRLRRVWRWAVLAAAVSTVVLTAALWPYWLVFHDQGLSRPLSLVAMYSATWRDYLTTPATFDYELWSHRWFAFTGLFPGGIALALAAVAVAVGTAFRDRRARMCLAFGLCGVVLSFGVKLPGYELLYRFVPIFRAIRAPARFGYLGIVAVAVLAGFGFAWLRQRLGERKTARMLASALILTLGVAESLVAPVSYTWFDHIPRIYDQLRGVPHAVVAEFPFYSSRALFWNGTYLLDSTRHWQPMLNGYSGFAPPVYFEYFDTLRAFPNPASVAALQGDGVTHIFVRLANYSPEAISEMNHNPALHLIALDHSDNIGLYGVDPAVKPRGASR